MSSHQIWHQRFHCLKKEEAYTESNIPKAPPISAPLVGMLTFTMPQSDPFGLWTKMRQLLIRISKDSFYKTRAKQRSASSICRYRNKTKYIKFKYCKEIFLIIPKPAKNPSQISGKDAAGKTLFYFIIPSKYLLFLLERRNNNS